MPGLELERQSLEPAGEESHALGLQVAFPVIQPGFVGRPVQGQVVGERLQRVLGQELQKDIPLSARIGLGGAHRRERLGRLLDESTRRLAVAVDVVAADVFPKTHVLVFARPTFLAAGEILEQPNLHPEQVALGEADSVGEYRERLGQFLE